MKKEHVLIGSGLFMILTLFIASFAFVGDFPGLVIMILYPWLVGSFFAVLCNGIDADEKVKTKDEFAWIILNAAWLVFLGPVWFVIDFAKFLYKELKKLD